MKTTKLSTKLKFIACSLFLFTQISPSHAIDHGFRFDLKKDKCVDLHGKEGLNPSFFGECGDLRGAKLNKTYLSGMKLEKADFSNANLFRANLRNANLKGAKLVRVDLTAADLRGADLTQANLTGAFLDRALFNRETKLPFSKAEALKRGMVLKN